MKIRELLSEITFYGRTCTKDCSGHSAGHAWAISKNINKVADCASASTSFTGGCQVAVAQKQLSAQQRNTNNSHQQLRAPSGKFQSKGERAFGAMVGTIAPK